VSRWHKLDTTKVESHKLIKLVSSGHYIVLSKGTKPKPTASSKKPPAVRKQDVAKKSAEAAPAAPAHSPSMNRGETTHG
jgi:hypothetical protein